MFLKYIKKLFTCNVIKIETEIEDYLFIISLEPINSVKRIIKNNKILIKCRDKDGCNLLYMATERGRLDIIKLLISLCKDKNEIKEIINIHDNKKDNGFTPLHLAIYYNRMDIVRYLLQNGADANMVDVYGYGPLFLPSGSNNVNMIKCLPKHGAMPRLKDLSLACAKGNIEIVKLLIIDYEGEIDSIIEIALDNEIANLLLVNKLFNTDVLSIIFQFV